jgi:hypothetical protein
MINYAFLTITDRGFWAGTVATVNSVLEFHPDAIVFVVQNDKNPLSSVQASFFKAQPNVELQNSSDLARDGRFINAWELKAHAAFDLSDRFDVIVGIDSDCLLCSNIEEEIGRSHQAGLFMGGRDGNGINYDSSYSVYGISPGVSSKYMSTSCYMAACTRANRRTLERWSECCNQAVFNGQGNYPGHGDQGVLNAILFAEDKSARVELLSNDLWSQHWKYWNTAIDYQNGRFVNLTVGGRPQRSFHCGGAAKYWVKEHSDRVLLDQPLQTYPYVWFLAMFWFGRCRSWGVDPFEYLPVESHHLVKDLHSFIRKIFAVLPRTRTMWDDLSDPLIDRMLGGIPRMLSLGGGSMTELIGLVANLPDAKRYVEIGGYLGGSLLTLALRFANRDIDFYSIETFMGNMDGSVDGLPLPSRLQFAENLKQFASLRANLIDCDSRLCAETFDDRSIDLLFVDGRQDTESVLRDIETWMPKVSKHGVIAGDDYGWDSVRQAVERSFANVNVSPSGCIWWQKLDG